MVFSGTSSELNISVCMAVEIQSKKIDGQLVIISFMTITLVDGVEKYQCGFFYPKQCYQLFHRWEVSIIQNRLNQKFLTDILLLILWSVPEQVAVFADKLFYFRGVDGRFHFFHDRPIAQHSCFIIFRPSARPATVTLSLRG